MDQASSSIGLCAVSACAFCAAVSGWGAAGLATAVAAAASASIAAASIFTRNNTATKFVQVPARSCVPLQRGGAMSSHAGKRGGSLSPRPAPYHLPRKDFLSQSIAAATGAGSAFGGGGSSGGGGGWGGGGGSGRGKALAAEGGAGTGSRYVEETVEYEVVPGGPRKTAAVRRLTGESIPGLTYPIRKLSLLDDAEYKADWPYLPRDFKRLDESDDGVFYSEPRLVYHIDEGAVAALTNYYRQTIPPKSDILDICSSWVSHYPQEFPQTMGNIVGTGMNAAELACNTQLQGSVARDLNVEPSLPFPDESFDVVTCVVSTDYLTKPLEVFKEIHRVLRPGGRVVLSQSNRCFFTKAIGMWLSMSDEDHLELLGAYCHYAGFKPATAYDISAKRESGDLMAKLPFMPGGVEANDPMFIVEAFK